MIRTQNHIHLGFTLGGAPENAPAQNYSAVMMSPIPEAIISFERSLNGTPYIHALVNDAGIPKVFENYEIDLLIRSGAESAWDQYEDLEGKIGQGIYFVPHKHPDDDEDHTASIRIMILDQVSPMEKLDQMLNTIRVKIVLMDYSVSGYGTGTILSAVTSDD